MTFAEKLKSARKTAGISQEALAEKLGVSRQAVTKWETDKGLPDVENIVAISNLFGVSVDDLLASEKESSVCRGYLYESRTEYDIDGQKKFDIKMGGASSIKVFGTDGEKVVVHLASNEITTLKRLKEDFKVKIDDIKGRIDVDVHRKNKMTEAKAKENLAIELFLPNKYLLHVDMSCNCADAFISNIQSEKFELGGKITNCSIESVESELEIDCNLDMNLSLKDFTGALAINQISSTSKLHILDDFNFKMVVKGVRTAVSYESQEGETEDFSDQDAENIVELNGINSELIVCKEGYR